MFGLVQGASAGPPANSRATNYCQQTSNRLANSCRQGAQSDFLLERAKCSNVSDAAARKACEDEAATNRHAANEKCSAGFDARQADCGRLGDAAYDPVIDPSNFSTTIDNPYYPLKPGRTFIYEGTVPEGSEHRELIVTHNTRVILGVTCVEVHDLVFINNALHEDTLDWFAQDVAGNVWYFGENSKQVADGLIVGLEGTFTAGVDGAKPGIIMEADNKIGDFYRQEFSLDTAEDLAEVQSLTENVTVQYGSFNNNNCLKTLETTPLKVNEHLEQVLLPGRRGGVDPECARHGGTAGAHSDPGLKRPVQNPAPSRKASSTCSARNYSSAAPAARLPNPARDSAGCTLTVAPRPLRALPAAGRRCAQPGRPKRRRISLADASGRPDSATQRAARSTSAAFVAPRSAVGLSPMPTRIPPPRASACRQSRSTSKGSPSA